MSEMRQRRERGEDQKHCSNCGATLEPGAKFCSNCGQKVETPAPTEDTVVKKADGDAEAQGEEPAQMREEVIREIQEKLLESVKRPEPKPGLTNETKKKKDALDKDPFNLQHMYELGHAYAVDEHWARCVNVMLRGWKRMSEVADPAARFEFLMMLCQASCRCKQFKQALAVLNDVEEPEDAKDLKGFLVMSCQVYSHNGDAQKALKAFSRAMKEEDFDEMLSVWVTCMAGLKKVGAYEAAKSTVDRRMETDEQRAKLSTLEKLSAMREQLEEVVQAKPATGLRNPLIAVAAVLAFLLCIWLLYMAESNSLSQIKK